MRWARWASLARQAGTSRPRLDARESRPSDHLQCAFVYGYGGAVHQDGRALSVADDDSCIGDRDHGAGCRLEEDAAGWSRRIADHERVLGHGLNHNSLKTRWGGEREGRHLGGRAEVTARPDGVIRVALLELDP